MSELLLNAQHQQWLRNPETQEFLNYLEKEKERLLTLSVSLGNKTSSEEFSLRKQLVKVKQIEEVINYARYRRTDRRDNNDE